jgi:acetyl-CoA carboxylase biotin carboxyl carrier protein
MDLKEIQALIKFVAKSGAQEVSLETEDFKINIKTGSDAEQPTIIQAMAPQAPVAMAAAPAAGSSSSSGGSSGRSSSR